MGRGGRKKQAGIWAPTIFESGLPTLNISLINSRPYRPQTNGKLEQVHKSLEDEIWKYPGLDDYIEYYNTDRLHFSLDMDNETPMMAFHNKRADEETRMRNPNWMGDGING